MLVNNLVYLFKQKEKLHMNENKKFGAKSLQTLV